MTTKILTQSQAEGVYAAMRQLNNVGGRFGASLPPPAGSTTCINIDDQGSFGVYVRHGTGEAGRREIYADQLAFAAAYGLPQPLRHFLVIGRMCGDDDDHGEYFEAATPEEARQAFMDELWGDAESEHVKEFQGSDMGVFIVQVWECPGPITLVP